MSNKKLRFGDIVTYKNGNKAIFIDKHKMAFENGCIGYGVNWDCVQKVERYVQLYNFHDHGIRIPMNYYCIKTIYEAKEILDEVEKEYLNNIIKPFKNKVVGICKEELEDNEFINIMIWNDGEILLPNFKKNTMYKGMKAKKQYSLKELGLED